MPKPNEKATYILEMTSTQGWKLVEDWIKDREEEIQRAALNNVINLKSSEFLKWQAYYAGEINLIQHFKSFIKKSMETDKPRMKNQLVKKFKDLIGG